ncbi:MAG: response regulator [bacterium]|nr:response regulator [bacterium]MDZ4286023.1 response regulator [Candidatus Sungbacteria bacterium]
MKKILFIEDESALQRAATRILTDQGYQTLSAMDGETGVALAQKEMPDLILLDLIIPKKDGFTVLEELKKDEKTKSIPVIVLTNLEGNADVERALLLGATTYLVKTNYQLEEVVEKIKGILDAKS